MSRFELGKKIGVKVLFVVSRRKRKLTWWQIFSARKSDELKVFFLWIFLSAQNSGVLEVLFLWFFLSARKSGESQFFFV